MSDEAENPNPPRPPLPLHQWQKILNGLIVFGVLFSAVGWWQDRIQFGYSYLLAFMFYLSLGLGALFLVLVHHLFDAGWSVPLRRFCEHIASLLSPALALCFIPLALLAPRLYPWMTRDPASDHALHAKHPLFTWPGFYLVAVLCFGAWWLLTSRLRHWSLQQDESGAAQCTHRMRFHASWGIFAFAVTLTLAAIMWMKALAHEWFSTMYGVYYFAGSVWASLGVVFIIMMILNRQRVITHVLHQHQYYFLGTLMLAFTVFYAYIHFSQYFVIWNGNLPEETFWYIVREQGSWWWIGMIIIFGHFFLPFLLLLRIDVKVRFWVMFPLGLWGLLMHYFDLSFNIMPLQHPTGFPLRWVWLDFACLALLGGLLTKLFLHRFHAHAPYPLKDPRLIEAMGLFHPVPTQISGGELDQIDDLPDAAIRPKGGH
ncbi:MAG: hypothetical protein KA236_14390 [Verrucomicrobia bacterium]|nr:hypothetical protein [Verrucomicrobiota bacterium]